MSLWLRRLALNWLMDLASGMSADCLTRQLLYQCKRGTSVVVIDHKTFAVGGVVQCATVEEAKALYQSMQAAMRRGAGITEPPA